MCSALQFRISTLCSHLLQLLCLALFAVCGSVMLQSCRLHYWSGLPGSLQTNQLAVCPFVDWTWHGRHGRFSQSILQIFDAKKFGVNVCRECSFFTFSELSTLQIVQSASFLVCKLTGLWMTDRKLGFQWIVHTRTHVRIILAHLMFSQSTSLAEHNHLFVCAECHVAVVAIKFVNGPIF